MTAAIVLAGGASTRFGGDKLAAELDGRPLLEHALAAVAQVADRLVVVLAPDADAPGLPRALAGRTLVARDAAPQGGPLAGVEAGLRALAAERRSHGERDEPVLVVGGDMPRLVPAVLRLLLATLDADPGCAAASLEAQPRATLPMAVRPLPALAAATQLLAADRRSLVGLLERLDGATIPQAAWRALDADGGTLVDVDSRGDLEGA